MNSDYYKLIHLRRVYFDAALHGETNLDSLVYDIDVLQSVLSDKDKTRYQAYLAYEATGDIEAEKFSTSAVPQIIKRYVILPAPAGVH